MCEDALRELESLHETISEGFADLSMIQEAGFNQLSNQLSEIATILEWGFGELFWQLEQQTEVLRSIDHTLKTPAETKANEWRLQAEELRRRGALQDSEEFFLKALNAYRLDYRIYIGLAETYLQMNKFDKAKTILENSLLHAPTNHCKSYSYRLIGHIYACEENYTKALEALHSAIKLYPDYGITKKNATQFIMFVENVYTISGRGTCVLGKVKHGTIKVGDTIEIVGSQETRKTTVKRIEAFREIVDEAFEGDIITVELGEIEKEIIKKGMVLATPGSITPQSKFITQESIDYDPDSFYDFAQYVSLVNDDVVNSICSQTFQEWGNNWALRDYNLVCFLSLQKAIEKKPLYFYLAEKERNFVRRKNTVQLALKNLLENACGRVEAIMGKINTVREEVDKAISEAKQAADKFRDGELESVRIYRDADSKLNLAKDKLLSGNYLKILEAEKLARKSLSLFEYSKKKARLEQNSYENSFKSKLKSAFNFCQIAALSAGIGFLLGIGGCLAHIMKGYEKVDEPIDTFFSTGLATTFIAMIVILFWRIYKIYFEKPTSKDKD